MARARSKSQRGIAWRTLRWSLLVVFWRLPRSVIRTIVWILRGVVGLFWRREALPASADGFYRSYRWRRLRVDALEANRQRYGMLACECCGMVDVASFHVDHIYPRSTHPELALEPSNLQVLCDACNVGKGTVYTTNWRGGEEPVVPKRKGWRRWFA